MLLNGYPFVNTSFEDPTLRLAADEMSALTRNRFPGAGNWEVKFAVEENLPSFEVRFENNVLTVAGPGAVEIL